MFDYVVHQETLEHGITIRIVPDSDPIDPRAEYDNASVMACWHRRYNLGDEQPREDPQEFLEELQRQRCEILPLYLYDHSGLSISTSGFSCPWDSGQIGYVYVTPETGRKEWGRKWREAARRCMRAETSDYDSYLRGNCYGFIIEDRHGDTLESVWGFIGDMDYCLQEARNVAKYCVEEARKAADEAVAAQFAPMQEIHEYMAANHAD